MSNAVHSGSCLCSGIQFIVRGAPEKVFACYCSDCSKNAGGSNQLCAKFPTTAVTVLRGESLLKTWIIEQTISESPKHKVFCERCGCTLWTIPMHHGGDKYILRITLLDEDVNLWKPDAEFFAKLRPKFQMAFEGTQEYDTMPGK